LESALPTTVEKLRAEGVGTVEGHRFNVGHGNATMVNYTLGE
jgi:hypothetical protein